MIASPPKSHLQRVSAATVVTQARWQRQGAVEAAGAEDELQGRWTSRQLPRCHLTPPTNLHLATSSQPPPSRSTQHAPSVLQIGVDIRRRERVCPQRHALRSNVSNNPSVPARPPPVGTFSTMASTDSARTAAGLSAASARAIAVRGSIVVGVGGEEMSWRVDASDVSCACHFARPCSGA